MDTSLYQIFYQKTYTNLISFYTLPKCYDKYLVEKHYRLIKTVIEEQVDLPVGWM